MKPATLACAFLLLVSCAGKTQLKVGKTDHGEVVEAEGVAPYNSADLLASKRASLVDAQKNAVEKAVGVFVSGKTFVEKSVAIENNILAKTEGYIKKYDVLKDWKEGDFYHTKIRALVSLKDLEKDLNDMSLLQAPELSRPRVLVLLAEKIQKDVVDEKPASAAMQKQLSDNGYVVLLSTGEAAADLWINGQATAHPFQSEGLGGFVSYRARLTVDAVRANSHKAIVSVTKEASGLGGNAELAGLKALETVGNLVGEELAKQLAENWSNKKAVFLSIEGVASFAEVDRLKKHVAAQPGVKDLVLRTYDEGMAQFEVELGGITSEELASRLDASQSQLLKVIEAQPQTIRFTTKK